MASELTMRYLERIGLSERPPLDAHGLETLQRAHMTAVPFENLDVFARRGVETGLDWSLPKVVERRRGGWCFELNGAFSALLTALGFTVRRLAATVLLEPAADFPSHLTLEVDVGGLSLVDVGFGDSFIRPLRLDREGPQDGGSGEFMIVSADGEDTLYRLGDDGEPHPLYRFDRTEWSLAEFDGASLALQTTPGLSWTRAPFATRLLDGGPDRVTLLENRIKFRRNGVWREEPVASQDWEAELDRWFVMDP
jgi:N-hydroxyarylamine O-acetyltransferase